MATEPQGAGVAALKPEDRQRWQRIEGLFEAAIERPEDEREAWLRLQCPDAELRAQVLDLLRRDGSAVGPLEALSAALASDEAGTEHLRGSLLGNYRLLETIGEGGMATVWRARREAGDFQREVAVKCLKAGFYSPAMRARFMAEQAILARLEHAYIARMYDGGVSANGTPYIVLELVAGQTLTAFADQTRMDVRQRLQLFLKVVDAVAHAHRELVVHRDLKPANILVDGQGEPRLLDFGIARLLEPDGTDPATTALRPLTPEYAAPEQLRGEAISVRTDVYALGLVLHELLCGERATDTVAARERTPPSTCLRRQEGAVATRAANSRRRTPAGLRRELRGDLDLIVLKCLRERPQQRYGSAEALAEDIGRWLERRPILARKGNRRYRARRFMQRNWLPLGALAGVLLALASGLLIAWREAARADGEARLAREAQSLAETEAARAEAISRFVVGLFEADIPALPRDQMPSTRDLVNRGIERARDAGTGGPALRADLLITLGNILRARLQFDEAAGLLAEAETLLGGDGQAEPEGWARALVLRADLLRGQRRYDELRAALDDALVFFETRLPDSPLHFEMLRDRAMLELHMEDGAAALTRLEPLLQRVSHRADLGTLPMRLMGDLANIYGRQGRIADAERMHLEVLAMKRAAPDTSPASIATTLFNIGSAAASSGRLDEAEVRYREVLASLETVDMPLQVRAAAWLGLARIAHWRGHFDDALSRIDSSAAEWARALDNPNVGDDFFIHYHSAHILADAGRSAEAVAAAERAVERMRRRQDVPAPRIADSEALLARLHCRGGEPQLAEAWLARARDTLAGAPSPALNEAEAACALVRGSADAALEWLGDVPATRLGNDPDTDRTRRMLLRAEALVRAGRGAEAVPLIEAAGHHLDALDADPVHPLRVARAQLARKVNAL